MLNSFQTPNDFDTNVSVNNFEIVYYNLTEIAQGGPVVGSVSINNKHIANYIFGGPWILEQQCVFIPTYVKASLGWVFRLASIDLDSLNVNVFASEKKALFFR